MVVASERLAVGLGGCAPQLDSCSIFTKLHSPVLSLPRASGFILLFSALVVVVTCTYPQRSDICGKLYMCICVSVYVCVPAVQEVRRDI